jgi:isopentenyl-diphosphate Delta-isomerase
VRDEDERVILVDHNDTEIGTAEKLDCHRRGVLHRAFSVMIWDRDGRMLLQQRALTKYHSGGLWTNACCGHPRPGEALADAASRRLHEEMGFTTPLTPLGSMIYRAELESGLTEHEFVHVFRGIYDGAVTPDTNECKGYTHATLTDIESAIASDASSYTAWFKIYMNAKWPVAA